MSTARENSVVADYTADLDGTPLLGHLVFYEVYQTEVTHAELDDWFTDLGLAEAYLPPELRADDAFERVTGPRGLRLTYPIDAPDKASSRSSRATDRADRQVTLMTRPVQRTEDRILRHLVREERNEAKARLNYKTRLAQIEFTRTPGTAGDGTITVTPNPPAISSLRRAEAPVVKRHLERIEETFTKACRFYASDRLRALVRDYLEKELWAIPLRTSGGVYFVATSQSDQLAALRELVGRFGGNSRLTRVPMPDTSESREMVGPALTAKVTADLDRLAAALATAGAGMVQPASRTKRLDKLARDFAAVSAAAKAHAEALKIGLEDVDDRLKLTSAQFTSLLLNAPDDDEEEEKPDES